MAFAFKRFRPDVTDPRLSEAQFRDQQYSAIINEMKILSHPPIKRHDNITMLIGVGFELFPETGQVWPVLIFSKFNRGDLASFILLNEDLSAETRLGICGQVANAVQGLHSCSQFYHDCFQRHIMLTLDDTDVVHGDLKPQNILINEDKTEDVISVGLTDFGFSSFSNSEDGLVRVPRSQPWEAPEWHLREFSLADAKKMDMYSFGLICLWIFFRGEDLSDISLPGATVDTAFSGTNLEATAAIQALKQNGDAMLQWTLQLLDKNLNIQDHTRACLQQIFRLILLCCPSERTTTVQVILRLLSDIDSARCVSSVS
jgi:serine/threonine protein kinase